MLKTVGSKVWAIPGGHVPLRSSGAEPGNTSRDELCVLNAGHFDAQLELTIYYEDHAPVGPYRLKVAAQRVRHVRFNDLIDPQALPLDTPYAVLILADHPVVVQFTRQDTSQAANAIATTLAFPG
ncbi:sensory rhodopsin transducer [Steroidobacter cummioxidans]|uniref:sensory rhodopsin transducer n=1 Tax=Steroidobacter cummioxidans TaxID=1803913 RepID=UPI000E31DBB4|nr:sensory rhodopsin transducer [Steroidobacter cummioxidans]